MMMQSQHVLSFPEKTDPLNQQHNLMSKFSPQKIVKVLIFWTFFLYLIFSTTHLQLRKNFLPGYGTKAFLMHN